MGKTLTKIVAGVAIIGLAVATGGISLAPSAGLLGFSVATTTLGGLALSIGAGLALSGVSGALAKTPKISPSQVDRLTANLVADAPRKIVFGHTALGTDIRYQEWWGASQEYLSQVLAVASHNVEAIEQIWLNDQLAWTSSGGVQGAFVGYFTVQTRPQPTVANHYTAGWSGRWGASAAFVGCADVYLQFRVTGLTTKAASPFSSSVPSRITIVGKAARLYDPRFDSSVGGSGSMRIADQSTWAWVNGGTELGRNPALELLFYLIGWREDGKLMVGRGVPADRLDLASFMTAANLCDEPVTLAVGGSEPRYRCDGMFSEADEPKLVIDSLCGSMNAVLRDAGGKLSLQVLHNDLGTPVLDFTEDDVLGDFTWSAGNDLNERINIVRGRYTDASANSLYQMVDYPAVTLSSLDGIDRPEPVDYPLVQSASQAQRLAKQRLQRSLYAGTFAADFNAKGWGVKDGDIVRLRFAALGFNYKLFRVAAGTVQVSGVAPLLLIEESAQIYAWDADERPAVVAATPNTFNPLSVAIVQAVDEAGLTAGWSGVVDDNGLRPEDGATKGAPAGTYVSDVEAAALVARTVSIEDILAPTGYVQTTLDAIQQAIADGEAGGVPTEVLTRITSLETAQGNFTGGLNNEITTRTNQYGTVTSDITTLKAQMAGTASSSLASSISTISSTATGAYSLASTASGNASSALGTANSAAIAASNAQSTANTANTKADNALSSFATVSSQVTTLTSSINALNAPNLLENPAFGNGLSAWVTGGSWSVASFPGITFAQANLTAYNGYIYQDVGSIQPGKPYSGSYETESDGGTNTYMEIQWLNSGGGEISREQGPKWSSQGWGNRCNGGAFTAAPGAAKARVVIWAGDGSGTRRVARIQFQQSSAPSPYADSASLTGLQAQVTTQAGTLANLQNKLLAYWQTEASVPGATAFITARADYNGNVGTSDVAIGAKVFMVYNPSGSNWLKTFEVSGGNVRIYGNLAVDGSVSTNNIQDNAVSQRIIFSGGSQVWYGDGYGGGYTNPGGGGGSCPAADEPVLLANEERTGPGVSIAAGRLKIGDWVWTKPERGRWGAFEVLGVRHFWAALHKPPGLPRTTGDHPFWIDGAWVQARTLGPEIGEGPAVQLLVNDAHTFVMFDQDGRRVLSHNKSTDP